MMMPASPIMAVQQAQVSSYLLDSISSIKIGLSFALLKSSYANGICCRIYNSLGSTLDIGFVNGVVDVASMVSFANLGNGGAWLAGWCDQLSGIMFLYDVGVPLVVFGGAVITSNGLPSAYFFDSSARHLRSFSYPTFAKGATHLACITVAKSTNLTANQGLITVGTGATGQKFRTQYSPSGGVGKLGARDELIGGVTSLVGNVAYSTSTPNIVTTQVNGALGTHSIYVDGALDVQATTTSGVFSNADCSQISVGAIAVPAGNSSYFQGYLSEVLLTDLDITADRVAIETHRKAYWGTP